MTDPINGNERMPPAEAPHRVRLPVNVQHWDEMAFLHWRVDPDVIRPRLPAGLEVDVHDGSAWVGVTPFVIDVRPLGVPFMLPCWSFPETNLRTYAVGPDGRQGIWFLRMEVPARWFVAALRTLGLPYVRQRMDVEVDGAVARYRSRPDRPAEPGGHEIVLRRDGPDVAAGDALARFVTARWDAYHVAGGRLLRTSVEHPPWQLRVATVETCDVGPLFAAAGLPVPAEAPVAHSSAPVAVRVSTPSYLRPASR